MKPTRIWDICSSETRKKISHIFCEFFSHTLKMLIQHHFPINLLALSSASCSVFWMNIPLSWSDGQYVGSTGLNIRGPSEPAHVTFGRRNTRMFPHNLTRRYYHTNRLNIEQKCKWFKLSRLADIFKIFTNDPHNLNRLPACKEDANWQIATQTAP